MLFGIFNEDLSAKQIKIQYLLHIKAGYPTIFYEKYRCLIENKDTELVGSRTLDDIEKRI